MFLYQSAQQVATTRNLQAFFQPILELRGDVLRLIAFEGFAHGDDDSFLGSPDLMCPDGQEAAADRTLLDVACLTRVLRAGADLPDSALLCLNVHTTTLALLPEFPAFLAECAAEAGIPFTRIILELNIGDQAGHGTEHLEVLDTLRSHGVGVALDGFGVGDANLDQILDIHPDILKLSPVLTHGLLRDPRRQAILEGLVDMTRKMGGRVLAKNLESVEDFRIARWMGVTLLQGYLFGVPGPISLWKEHPFPQEWHLRSFMRRPAALIPPPERSKPTSRDIIH
jgi:EAL domain-containing protein (putative c-di-GMP-specific phosphodiesterase class I)